ncbi:MAG: mandelate racemase/muconate lactonizing enzyme family protein [Lachnospiraceae bacterium]|nr:mandelate racemase/muconate lactonizing enzyme family protein [Lachnospiraceae bacterium]
MKIVEIKQALIGHNIVLRVVTDKGIDGYSEIENTKEAYIGAVIPYFAGLVKGLDPTDVSYVMAAMKRAGAFKPWGAVVSAIEMACWDIAGKEAGVPVYKLLGGKVRNKVRVYNGSFKTEKMLAEKKSPDDDLRGRQYEKMGSPEEIGESMLALSERPEGFTICKMAFGWHAGNFWKQFGLDEFAYNTYPPMNGSERTNRGSMLTERGFNALVEYVDRLKAVIGDKIGLALDCGPGFCAADALRFAKAVEPYHLLWLEDMIAGDYTPHTMAHVYRDITMQTSTPIHTGEQIYLRENYRELIEGQCVNVVGPDPADCGGIAELKWIAEYADLHGIHMAPHGTFDGIFGMAALTQVCATMPQNYIAYEYPAGNPEWWYDIVDGLPDNFLRDGHVQVWDRPGIGVEFNIPKAEKYLRPEDKDFFR